MTDLILHAGLPKTGTSTVQAHALGGRTNFLGKDKHGRCLSGSSYEAKQLVTLVEATRWEPHSTVRARAQEWAAHCDGLMGQAFADHSRHPKTVVLSEEKLVSWPLSPTPGSRWPITTGLRSYSGTFRERPAPLVRLLREHGAALWPFGRIRILLTLRNQADWLASHYSQLSSRILNASQRDFEERVEHLTASRDPFLDWSGWVDDLAGVVGPDNLRILLMEEMDSPMFWADLANFLQLEDLGAEELASGGKKRNVRKDSAPGRWRLRQLKVKKAWAQGWSKNDSMRHRFLLKAIQRSESLWIRPLLRATLDRGRESWISLDEHLRDRILQRLGPSNERLAYQLGKDLRPLGYFGHGQDSEIQS